MAPVAGFVPELISNVLKSPFLRKGNKTPRRGSTTDEATPSSSEPQAGSPDAAAAVLQSSPRVATLDNQALSASVESIKEPPIAPSSSFASLDSLASQDSLRSRASNAHMKLEPIIEQPTPSDTPNVSPPQEKDEPSYPTISCRNSSIAAPSPIVIEASQAHIVNDSPSARTVTFLTAARASTLRTGVSFQSFGSPYPPSVEKMDPDGSADMSISSEDEPMVFATPPVTPTLASSFLARDSPPAVVLLSPSLEVPPVDLFAQHLIVPTRLSAPLRTASGSTSGSRPSSSRCSSTGLSSDTGNASSLPLTPLNPPAAHSQSSSAIMWVGESSIEPIGVPLPSTYAEARDLASVYPEIAEELLKRPLASSRPHSRAPSCDGRVTATPSPAPTSDNVASDADDADDERSQKWVLPRRREHSPDHPDWAVAPDAPKDEGRERKKQRGRGRERPTPKESESPATRSGGKPRNRRGRGRKLGVAASFERLHAASTSTSEAEASPAQDMVERLLRGIKELTSQPSEAEAAGKRVTGQAGPVASDAETRAIAERADALLKLVEAKKTRELGGASSSVPTTPANSTPGSCKIRKQPKPNPFGTPESLRSSPATSAARGNKDGKQAMPSPKSNVHVQAGATSTSNAVKGATKKAEGCAPPTLSHSRLSALSLAQLASDSPFVKLPQVGKAFSPIAPGDDGRQASKEIPLCGPEILSGPTPSSAFTSSPSAFTALTADPAAAAIVNIAHHAHSSAAELAKRASVSDLGGAAKANADVSARALPPSVVNDAMTTPHLFSAPIANVNAAVPPSMVQPALNAPASTAQPSSASPDTGTTQPRHTVQFTPSPAPTRMHARRGSTASLCLATPVSGSSSPTACYGGISKRASVASLRGQPAVPSPLSRMSPVIGQTARSPEVKAAPSTPPPPKIYAPTPVFGSILKRTSVADLTAAAASPAFTPDQLQATHTPAAPSMTGSSIVSSVQPIGEVPLGAAPATGTTSRGPAVIYETPQRHMPSTARTSSPAVAWTPATRPKATEEDAGPGIIGEARHHSAGGALAGYDAPPASPVVGAPEWKPSAVDISSLAETMVDRLRVDEGRRRQRTFTNAPPPDASLCTSVSAGSPACDSPVSRSVQDVPVAPALLAPFHLETKRVDLPSPLAMLQDFAREEEEFRLSAEAADSLQAKDADRPPAAIEVAVCDAGDKPVRPPTPSGQVSLTNLVAQLQVGDAEAPIRPTSVVPSIHAGTPDRPVHWTIDDQGKLRAKKDGNDAEPEQERQSQLAQTQTQPQPQPEAQRTAGPPPRRRERAGEQPEAYKPYPQNAGPAQPADRFSMFRRRSMYFAREEGGIRGETSDKEASPSGGAGLWRKGSGNWRKRDDEE